MDWLRKELSDNYSNTFQYNQQGDPESVFVLFNRVLRKIMGTDTSALESVKLENGSVDTTSQNITDSSILSKLAKITKPRKIGCKVRETCTKESLFYRDSANYMECPCW